MKHKDQFPREVGLETKHQQLLLEEVGLVVSLCAVVAEVPEFDHCSARRARGTVRLLDAGSTAHRRQCTGARKEFDVCNGEREIIQKHERFALITVMGSARSCKIR